MNPDQNTCSIRFQNLLLSLDEAIDPIPIVQSKLVDIVNADIDNAAAIAWSKLATDSLDATVTKVNLKDYGETTNAIGGTGGGTQDIDLTLGNSVTATVDTSANTFTFYKAVVLHQISCHISYASYNLCEAFLLSMFR